MFTDAPTEHNISLIYTITKWHLRNTATNQYHPRSPERTLVLFSTTSKHIYTQCDHSGTIITGFEDYKASTAETFFPKCFLSLTLMLYFPSSPYSKRRCHPRTPAVPLLILLHALRRHPVNDGVPAGVHKPDADADSEYGEYEEDEQKGNDGESYVEVLTPGLRQVPLVLGCQLLCSGKR